MVQMTCAADKATNLDKAIRQIRAAKAKGAQIVCLQELFTSLYFCDEEQYENFNLAEAIPGPSTDALSALAGELGVVIIASLFEKRAQGLYHNTTAVLDADGTYLGKYRKMHIPDDPHYYEKFYFTPGDLGYKIFNTRFGKIGVLICWDQWYPEAARLMALAGAEILIYPTAIGWESTDTTEEKERQRDAWITVQRSHAVANGIPVISCNRVGYEADPSGITKGIQFWGTSFIAGPQGEILTKTSDKKDENLVFDLDLNRTETVRRWWPFFRDRRIDAYHDLIKRWK